MRLIETTTLAMETHYGRDTPPYAILSHTWEDEEVTLQDWNSPTRDGMKGFHKIRMTCQLAADEGLKYAWVDTCCIDKSNSAELSEAINSMYRWYQRAKVCYAYLSDFRPSKSIALGGSIDLTSLLRGCRWFSRGWTLQELLAPVDVCFYQHDWELIGNKKPWFGLLSDVTGISRHAILHYCPMNYSIAERMSWAASRETTREEDTAYCLLGIFNVNMPMLYGEGARAFRRLQEEIIRTGYDVSIFAWTKPASKFHREGPYCGVFAKAPRNFHLVFVERTKREPNEVSITNAGLKSTYELCLVRMPQTGMLGYVLPVSTCRRRPHTLVVDGLDYKPRLGVKLEKISSDKFVRKGFEELVEIPRDGRDILRWIRCPDTYILIDLPLETAYALSLPDLYRPRFELSPGCRVVKTWPSGSWNDVASTLMINREESTCGSILLEVQPPMQPEDGFTGQRRTGDFMFLFHSFDLYGVFQISEFTVVGYREYQLILDTINLRIGARNMDAEEMRRTLRNFAIPEQRRAAAPIEGTDQCIYISVDFDERSPTYTFNSSLVAFSQEH